LTCLFQRIQKYKEIYIEICERVELDLSL